MVQNNDDLSKIIAEIDSVAQPWIDDAVKVKRSELPEYVYHYTDAAGLVGMLTSGKVWLTDYRFLNDKTEITHTKNLVSKIVEDRRRVRDDDKLLKLYADIMEYHDRQERYATPFVFSLSEEDDDLSQWRGYAREGQGFTIGFDSRVLCEASEKNKNVEFSKIDYDISHQLKALNGALDDIAKKMREEIESNKTIPFGEIVDEAARTFDWVAHSRGALNKHGSFRAEKEWRLIDYAYRDEEPYKTKVRASAERLIPYLEIAPWDSEKLPIGRIGIGPGFADTSMYPSVQALCKQYGYEKIKIYQADTPFRSI